MGTRLRERFGVLLAKASGAIGAGERAVFSPSLIRREIGEMKVSGSQLVGVCCKRARLYAGHVTLRSRRL
eukprot:6752240-Pyramimonas_sp.AAC.1